MCVSSSKQEEAVCLYRLSCRISRDGIGGGPVMILFWVDLKRVLAKRPAIGVTI